MNARPARVLHLIPCLDVGGAERALVNLVNGLDQGEFVSTVVSMMPPGPLAAALSPHVPVATLAMRRGRPSVRAWFALRRIVEAFRPDIVQTWLYHADLLGSLVAGCGPVPVLCWNIRCSNMDLSRYRPLTRMIRWLLARLSTRPSAIVVNSEAGRRFHVGMGYAPRHWETISNGFDTSRFAPDPSARHAVRRELGIPDDAFVVGHVARLDPAKDHATFLAAAGHVLAALPSARFVLAGEGVSALAGRADKLGIRSAVHLLEARGDIEQLMCAFDAGCLSSAWGEGFPNALGEMMGCEIPCVTTDVGDAALIVGDTGRVVPAGAAPALADALLELGRLAPARRATLGQAARRHIEDRFSMAAMIARYSNLYHELVTPPASVAHARGRSRS